MIYRVGNSRCQAGGHRSPGREGLVGQSVMLVRVSVLLLAGWCSEVVVGCGIPLCGGCLSTLASEPA